MSQVVDVPVDDGRCVLCAMPWVACMCAQIVDDLEVSLRRCIECGDLVAAAEIVEAIELRGAGRA